MIGAILSRRALAGAFDALNHHDLARFMAAWREDGIFVYPGDIPASGIFRGKGAVEAWFQRFFEQFPQIRFELHDLAVKRLFDFTGTNVIAAHWDIHLVNREGRAGGNSGVTVVTAEGGKVVSAKDYIFDLGEEFHRNWSA